MRAHRPEWTDENRSDPGITLVLLFAFLAVAFGAVAIGWLLVREGRRSDGVPTVSDD